MNDRRACTLPGAGADVLGRVSVAPPSSAPAAGWGLLALHQSVVQSSVGGPSSTLTVEFRGEGAA